MWDDGNIAPFTRLGDRSFYYRNNAVALSGLGRSIDPPVSASFTYDDTAFGKVPDGILKTLASCAVTAYPYSGQYVQLKVQIGQYIGYRPYTSGLGPPGGHVAAGPIQASGGQLTAFAVNMPGSLDLADPGASSSADGLVTIASELPYTPPSGYLPQPWLLRPSALTWPGQDPANQANRTIWKVTEVAKATIAFTVTAQTLDSQIGLSATGWL